MSAPSTFRSQAGIRGARVSLSSRTRIECNESSLYSVEGGQQVISMIESRRVVHTLQISHNELGDDGCVTLFDFLGSNKGRQHPISDIQIGSNKLGNAALLAIAAYLKGNLHLRCLDLPNNAFIGDRDVGSTLALAINSSRLETLNLSSNIGLSDTFIASFLPSLECRSLCDLSLSAMGITSVSVPHIADYLSSHRCYLNSFSCNANRLGYTGLQVMYEAMRSRRNYRLTKFTVFANHHEDDDQSAKDESKRVQSLLRILVAHNMHLNEKTKADALRLLRYSRPLLLHSADTPHRPSLEGSPCDESCSCFPTPRDRADASTSSPSEAPFFKLPTEMKQYILSFFAPSLSAAQLIRVFHYASSASTLPPLLPCLPSPGSRAGNHSFCVPDPSNLAFGDSNEVWKIGGRGLGVGGGCAPGRCLGSSNSLVCHREQDSKAWLDSIGCDAYEED